MVKKEVAKEEVLKKAMSAFMCFSNAKRPAVMEEIKAENDGKLLISEVGKKIGAMWKDLSDKDRAPFDKLAVKDKERYEADKAAGMEPKERKSKKDKEDGKKKKDPNAPKRNLSAYFFFGNAKRPDVMEQNKADNDGKVVIAEVGKKIGELWAALSDKDKEPFEKMAVKDKKRYEKEKAAYESGAAPASPKSPKSAKSKSPKSVK